MEESIEEVIPENSLIDFRNYSKEKFNFPINFSWIEINGVLKNSFIKGLTKNSEENKDQNGNVATISLMKYLDFYQNFFASKEKNLLAHQLIEKQMDCLYTKILNNMHQNPKIQNLEKNYNVLDFLSNDFLNSKFLINTYFDKIYVLNLDRRPDRMEAMKKNLEKCGIYNWTRFSAVDGSISPHYEEWRHFSKQRLTRLEKMKYHRKAIASYGSWGILKSMYFILDDAQKNNYSRILILQDDLLFHKSFDKEFLKIPSYIPNQWKLLYIGATQHNWTNIMTSKHFYHPNGTADGAFAVGIDKSVYQELIDEIIKFDMPVDSGALRTIQHRYPYECFVIYPNLIIADIRDSDLRHSRDLHSYGKRFKWDIDLYDIPNK